MGFGLVAHWELSRFLCSLFLNTFFKYGLNFSLLKLVGFFFFKCGSFEFGNFLVTNIVFMNEDFSIICTVMPLPY